MFPVVSLLWIVFTQPVFPQKDQLFGALELRGGSRMIQSFILVSDSETVRFSATAACDEGLESLEISAGEKVVFLQECAKAPACRVAGVTPTSGLPTHVIAATALCSSGAKHREKIRINPGEDGPKVYLVASLPHFTGDYVPIIASAPGDEDMNPPAAPDEIALNISGPSIAVEVLNESPNSYLLRVLAEDPYGVDFIELLKDGVFYYVELCQGRTRCELQRSVAEHQKRKVTFLIKSMNLKERFSSREEILSFEAQARETPPHAAPENKPPEQQPAPAPQPGGE
ncbi:MAG: hypothetical protein AB1742_00815 [bacterium]